MTSSKWKPFPRYWPYLCGEFTGQFPAQRPVTRSFDVFLDLHPNKRLNKQSWSWWFETPSRSLWRHCNDARFLLTVISILESWIYCLLNNGNYILDMQISTNCIFHISVMPKWTALIINFKSKDKLSIFWEDINIGIFDHRSPSQWNLQTAEMVSLSTQHSTKRADLVKIK